MNANLFAHVQRYRCTQKASSCSLHAWRLHGWQGTSLSTSTVPGDPMAAPWTPSRSGVSGAVVCLQARRLGKCLCTDLEKGSFRNPSDNKGGCTLGNVVLLLEASGDFVAVPLCSGSLTGEGAGAPVSCNALGYGLHLGLQAGSAGIL